jgi:hypothetical protein
MFFWYSSIIEVTEYECTYRVRSTHELPDRSLYVISGVLSFTNEYIDGDNDKM